MKQKSSKPKSALARQRKMCRELQDLKRALAIANEFSQTNAYRKQA